MFRPLSRLSPSTVHWEMLLLFSEYVNIQIISYSLPVTFTLTSRYPPVCAVSNTNSVQQFIATYIVTITVNMLPTVAYCNVYIHCNTSLSRNLPFKIQYSSRKCVLAVNFVYLWITWKVKTDNNKETSQILNSKYEYHETVHRLFIDLMIQFAVRNSIIFTFSLVSTWTQKDQ